MLSQRLYASFPWYDLPEMHAATNALWRALANAFEAEGLDDVPLALDRDRPHGSDGEGACLFTQTCGYPLWVRARGHFAVLGTPRYDAPGCEGPLHRSFVVVRADSGRFTLEDLRGARFAVNEPDSNSGMNLPRHLVAPLARDGRFFGGTVVTGSHAESAALVAGGGADAAALDCVTFALLQRYRPAVVAGLRTIAHTASTPAPPLVTSSHTSLAGFAALRRGIATVMNDPALAATRSALLLQGVTFCDDDAYRVVLDLERDAVVRGYPMLA